jgi:hypothetical protein
MDLPPINEYIELCESAFDQPAPVLASFDPGLAPLYFFFRRDYQENLPGPNFYEGWSDADRLPESGELGAFAARENETLRTVVCILEKRLQVFTYKSTGPILPGQTVPGYKLVWQARLVTVGDGRPVGMVEFTGQSPPNELDSTQLATGGNYGPEPLDQLLDWLAVEGEQAEAGLLKEVAAAAFSQDGSLLAVASKKQAILRILAWPALSELGAIRLKEPATRLDSLPGGRLAVQTASSLAIYDLQTGQLAATYPGLDGTGGTAMVHASAPGRPLLALTQSSEGLSGYDWQPNAGEGAGLKLYLWDTAGTPSEVQTAWIELIAAAFVAGDRLVALGCSAETHLGICPELELNVYDLGSQAWAAGWDLGVGQIHGMAAAAGGEALAIAACWLDRAPGEFESPDWEQCDWSLRLVDISSGEVFDRIPAPEFTQGITASADGRLLAFMNGTVSVLDLEARRALAAFAVPGLYHWLFLSPDGKVVGVIADGDLRFYELPPG